ncbi:phosphotriesterase [Microbacterium elymi]|uniref:Phosphotriesterase n=1 Tax=Microbacterium elymi TaxID=2909587 RepID=A0ABY5NGP7_9MICO|nr:phosphotriesterase [Microbacterium elymi]UUT34378.1 phosphotriesterase [Microbacterium elymi]
MSGTVHTVLGDIPADQLGVVATHEALLSVVPGAQYAYDIPFDRSEIFAALAVKLRAFAAAGGGTVVDATGMFHGRDLPLYEALSRATGVHIVASTGQGPEDELGGYFLTPQTNPPTPWPAERFAELYAREITEGMVVPRVERRGHAGLIAIGVTPAGMTPTDESQTRGAARAAVVTGTALSVRYGADAVHDLEVVRDAGLPVDRVVVGGLDRPDALATGAPIAVAEAGAYVGIDHIGHLGADLPTDLERAQLVAELISAGHGDRIILSSSAIGVAKGHPDADADTAPEYAHVLEVFVPMLRDAGVPDDDIHRLLVDNPAALLAVKEH